MGPVTVNLEARAGSVDSLSAIHYKANDHPED